MGKGAAGAFVTGLLQGGLAGYRYNKDQEDKDEERQIRLADQQMRREEADRRKEEADRVKGDRVALQNAAAPVTVNDQAATLSLGGGQQPVLHEDAALAAADARQARGTMGMPDVQAPQPAVTAGGKQYGSRDEAQAVAAAANTPEARAERVSLAMMERGKPMEALEFQNKTIDHKTKTQQFADGQWDRDLRQSMGAGHEGIAQFMSNTQAGPFKGVNVKAIPSADGKTVTYNKVNADGTTEPTPYTFPNNQDGVIQAGYRLANISPEVRYKHMVDADKAAFARDAKDRELGLRERQLNEVQVPLALARGEAAQASAQASLARAEAANRKGGASEDNKVSREERLRWTSLHSESGRRLSDANKALAAVSRDPAFMVMAKDPKSPQAQQLAGLQADVAQYKEDRDMYGSLLAGSQGAAARAEREAGKGVAGAPDAKPVAPAGKPGSTAAPQGKPPQNARPTSKAEYDALPPGSRYFHPGKQEWLVKG